MVHIFDLQELKIDRATLLNITRLFADEEGTCLLFSGKQYEQASQSYLCLFPFDVIHIHKGKQTRKRIGEMLGVSLSMENPWEALKVLLKDQGDGDNSYPEWLGFFGPQKGAYRISAKDTSHPLFFNTECYLQRCGVILSVDHKTNQGKVCIADQAEYFFDDEWRHWVERLSEQRSWNDLVNSSHVPEREEGETISSMQLTTSQTIESLMTKIENTGDKDPHNWPQKMEFVNQSNSFSLFTKLAKNDSALFSAYIQCKDFSLISSSSERISCKLSNLLESPSNAMGNFTKLENNPYGMYSGVVGYFAYNGDCDLNIATRTLLATDEGLSIQLGTPESQKEDEENVSQSIVKAFGLELPAAVAETNRPKIMQ